MAAASASEHQAELLRDGLSCDPGPGHGGGERLAGRSGGNGVEGVAQAGEVDKEGGVGVGGGPGK